jgi:hypothetical protein
MKNFIGNYFNAWDEINALYGNRCRCSYDLDCRLCGTKINIVVLSVIMPLFVMELAYDVKRYWS